MLTHDIPSLVEALRQAGFPAVHARPLLRAFYDGSGRIDFSRLRVGRRVEAWVCGQAAAAKPSDILRRALSNDGTLKLLIGFASGSAVEAVLMPGHRPDRAAVCVSSQVGCAMGCDFCASAKGGLVRNLDASEIVEQFLIMRREAAAMARRITSLVFMGMGEPLHNLPNVLSAIRRIGDPDLGGLGWRQITVSTAGLVPGIDALADADLNVHLAVSLHAPDDTTRSRLVPLNRRWRVAEVLAAARRFLDRTGRIPTIEYCLLEGVNDSDEQALMLAEHMRGFRAHVNLIPHNPIGAGLSGAVYRRPSPDRIDRFLRLLRASHVVAHLRDTRGDDVSAACGQLRADSNKGETKHPLGNSIIEAPSPQTRFPLPRARTSALAGGLR